MDSQKTKLLKTKTFDFSINNKQFSSKYFKKSQNNDNIFIENPKNYYIFLVKYYYLVFIFSISPIQKQSLFTTSNMDCQLLRQKLVKKSQ